jgi:HKD family nuclease
MTWAFLTEDKASKVLRELVKRCRKVHVAVAWATDSADTKALLQSGKLGLVVIGTDGYVTSPKVLRACSMNRHVRVVPPDAPRLFHPKLYFFEMGGGEVAILIGSHNLTRAAFGGSNIEASALLHTQLDDPFVEELEDFISQHWEKAEPLQNEDFLFAYEAQYATKAAARKTLRTFTRLRAPLKDSLAPSPLSFDWAEYLRKLKSEPGEGLVGRMRMLERTSALFEKYGSLTAMSVDERKAVAGTYAKGESTLDGLDWAWLGSARGFGDFKSLVKGRPQTLAKALDHIPRQGPVQQTQYVAFVRDFRNAFEGLKRVGGHRVATRLLAVKRPDWFVPVNSANESRLCGALGVRASKMSLDTYWGDVVEPVHASAWWQEHRPRAPFQAEVWDMRAALLDVLYYVPNDA